MRILTISNLSIYYKNKSSKNFIVKDFNLSIDEGEIVLLTGKNGSGKTSIAKTVIGLHSLYEGNIDYFIDKSAIQYIFQDPYSSLNPFMNVSYIISEGMKFKNKNELDENIIKIMQEVGLDINKRFCLPSDFSGGERQKIAIARALIRNPKLVIADEITSSIDYFSKIALVNLLKKLQKERKFACLLISHDLEFAHKLTDKIVSIS